MKKFHKKKFGNVYQNWSLLISVVCMGLWVAWVLGYVGQKVPQVEWVAWRYRISKILPKVVVKNVELRNH